MFWPLCSGQPEAGKNDRTVRLQGKIAAVIELAVFGGRCSRPMSVNMYKNKEMRSLEPFKLDRLPAVAGCGGGSSGVFASSRDR